MKPRMHLLSFTLLLAEWSTNSPMWECQELVLLRLCSSCHFLPSVTNFCCITTDNVETYNNNRFRPLSGTSRVSRYQKKHSLTHHPDHHPIFISFFRLLLSIASSLSIFGQIKVSYFSTSLLFLNFSEVKQCSGHFSQWEHSSIPALQKNPLS